MCIAKIIDNEYNYPPAVILKSPSLKSFNIRCAPDRYEMALSTHYGTVASPGGK